MMPSEDQFQPGASPALAVVIIGRNEGERLRRCLLSVEKMLRPEGGIEVVYVDTASQDGSAEMVERERIRTIRLFPRALSAALARNAGWRAVSAPFVLFLDGDSQIERDFAVRALPNFKDPKVAIVWGRLREAYPSASLYNRLMHVQWICLRTLPEGPCFYGTGIGLVRRSALEAVGGFNDKMVAGENTEMGRRIQSAGYVVLHLALPMVRHDADMLHFIQYCRRFFREGYSYARLLEVYRSSRQPLFRFEFSPLGGALILVGLPVMLVGSVAFRSWAVLAAPSAVLLVLLARTALRYRPMASNLREAALFSIHWHLKLIPNFLGHFTYHFDRIFGRERGLMEYRKHYWERRGQK
jgi:glycosyltransferase involved in cell wall biosynthesis